MGASAEGEDLLALLLGCRARSAWLHECVPEGCRRTPGRSLSLEAKDAKEDEEGEGMGPPVAIPLLDPDAVTRFDVEVGSPLHRGCALTPKYSLTPRAGDVLGAATPRWVTPIREALVGGGR